MALRKNITPSDNSRSIPPLYTFPYSIVTESLPDGVGGLLSTFFKDNDDPDDDFGSLATDFSYEKFQMVARFITGHQGANKWRAVVGGNSCNITEENEWHRFLLRTQRILQIHADLSVKDLHITFSIPLDEQGSEPGGGAIPEEPIGGGGTIPEEPIGGGGAIPEEPIGGGGAIPEEPIGGSSKRGLLDLDNDEENTRQTKKPRVGEILELEPKSPRREREGSEEDLFREPTNLNWAQSDDDDDEEPSRPTDMSQPVKDAGSAGGLYEIDALDGISLNDVAQYFGVSPNIIESDTAHTLKGTKQPIRLDQTVFVYRYLSRCDHSAPPHRCGQVLADKTGMGKTRSAYALVAEMRWTAINAQHVNAHPDQHLGPESTETICPSPHWRGSECACVKGSIRHHWAQRLFGGPYLIITPASISHQWEFAAEEYFYRFIDNQGMGYDRSGDGRTEFIDPYAWNNGTFQRATTETDLSEAEYARLKAAITGEGRVYSQGGQRNRGITPAELKALFDKKDRRDYCSNLRELAVDVLPRRVPDGSSGTEGNSKLIVIAESMMKSKTSKATKELTITANTPIRAAKPVSKELKIPFAVPPTLVVLDEAHLFKPGNTLSTRLDFILYSTRPAAVQARQPSWLFLSATMFDKGPSSLSKLLDYLYANEDDAETADKRLETLNNTYKQLLKDAGSSPDADSLLTRITELSRDVSQRMAPVVIARREGTPMGAGRRVAAYSGKIHDIRRRIELRDDEIQALEGLRSAWGCKLTGSSVIPMLLKPPFLRYYCATLMPGLALAANACEGYPFNSKEVKDDLKKKNSSIILANLHHHNGSHWLKIISNIIHKAWNDRGKNKDEPRKNVLIVTANPCVAHHLHRVLLGQGLSSSVDITMLSSDLGPRDRGHEIRNLRRKAAASKKKIQIIVSTAALVGTGIDGLSFCSYLIIFGDLTEAEQFQQVRGRVARAGQLYDTHVYSLSVEHDVQELVRRSVQHPDQKLDSLGVFDADE